MPQCIDNEVRCPICGEAHSAWECTKDVSSGCMVKVLLSAAVVLAAAVVLFAGSCSSIRIE